MQIQFLPLLPVALVQVISAQLGIGTQERGFIVADDGDPAHGVLEILGFSCCEQEGERASTIRVLLCSWVVGLVLGVNASRGRSSTTY